MTEPANCYQVTTVMGNGAGLLFGVCAPSSVHAWEKAGAIISGVPAASISVSLLPTPRQRLFKNWFTPRKAAPVRFTLREAPPGETMATQEQRDWW